MQFESRAVGRSVIRHELMLSSRWPLVFVGLCVMLATVFLALPWSLETKALAVLHGLCAQQPSHTFYVGEARLPFDARMTGIYGGFGVTALSLVVMRRWRAAQVPPVAMITVLGAFVVLMGVDGVNSTLADLRQWHLYEPRNELRLITGQLTGVTLATFVLLLVGQIGYAQAARRSIAPVAGWRDLAFVLAAQSLFTAFVFSGWAPLRVPITLLLLVAACAAVTGLTLAFVLLFGRRESLTHSASGLAGPATLALVIALVIIGGLGGGRFLLEWWLNIPTLMPEMQGTGR